MTINDLRIHVIQTIENLRDHGKFPKENNLYDYKAELNLFGLTDHIEIFLRNFAKDILSFSNGNGGIILLGIKEDKPSGNFEDIGLNSTTLEIMTKIDLGYITQKFEKLCKVGLDIDLQPFQLGTRKFYSLLIEKQNQVVIPVNDYPDYGLKKGEITYRALLKVFANEELHIPLFKKKLDQKKISPAPSLHYLRRHVIARLVRLRIHFFQRGHYYLR